MNYCILLKNQVLFKTFYHHDIKSSALALVSTMNMKIMSTNLQCICTISPNLYRSVCVSIPQTTYCLPPHSTVTSVRTRNSTLVMQLISRFYQHATFKAVCIQYNHIGLIENNRRHHSMSAHCSTTRSALQAIRYINV